MRAEDVTGIANKVAKGGERTQELIHKAGPPQGYCQVGITSPLPILTRLCTIATAVAISSMLFNVFEFTLLQNLFVLFFNSLNNLSILYLFPKVSWK
jgi:hypothetical protein